MATVLADASGENDAKTSPATKINLDMQRQDNTFTEKHRNLKLIMKLEKLVPTRAPRVLCFGCSAGYEVLDILTVFPLAHEIIALDINPSALQKATQLLESHPQVKVMHSKDFDEEAHHGAFDLVTSCYVLCRYPQSAIKPILPYKMYNETIDSFVKMASNHACIFVHGANYSIRNYVFDKKAQVDFFTVDEKSSFVPQFTPDGKPLSPRESVITAAVIRKKNIN